MHPRVKRVFSGDTRRLRRVKKIIVAETRGVEPFPGPMRPILARNRGLL